MPKITGLFGLGGNNDEERALALLQAYNLELACVTRGAQGSLIVTEREVVDHPSLQITVRMRLVLVMLSPLP